MTEPDPEVAGMISARNSVAVLKMDLIKVRARCPGIPIIVVEGVDDKVIYSHWITRVRSDLEYEFYTCKGKDGVLKLRDAADRDLSNLSDQVFIFIDRDFDDLRDHLPSENTFMTDSYSVDNYLVDYRILDLILSVELHCDGSPATREKIVGLFNHVYDEFLEVTREYNFRLYFALVNQVKRVGQPPEKISGLAIVKIDGIEELVSPPEEVIRLEREPTDGERAACSTAFSALSPRERYRGKFALKFFMKWLDLLADEYSSKSSPLFAEIDITSRAKRQEFVVGTLASRSSLPSGFAEFVRTIQ